MSKAVRSDRGRLATLLFLPPLTVTALICMSIVFIPENYWVQSRAYINYRPSVYPLKPLLIWNTNEGEGYVQFFSVRTFTFPSSPYTILIPLEFKKRAWIGNIYVDPKGQLLIEPGEYDEFRIVDRKAFVDSISQFNRIIYNDEIALQIILDRIPELKKILELEKYRPAADSHSHRPLLFAIPWRDFLEVVPRLLLFLSVLWIIALVISSFLGEERFSSVRYPLSAAMSFGSVLLIYWLFAELKVLHWVWILVGLLLFSLLLFYLRRSRPAWNLRAAFSIRNLCRVALLFLVCEGFLFYGNRFRLDSDISRYLDQGRFLSYFNGWDGDQLSQLTTHSYSTGYPYGVGIVYDWLLHVGATPANELLYPGWRFSLVFMLNQVSFGFLNSLVLWAVYEIRGKIGSLGASFLAVLVLSMPTFRGFSLGAENLYWPYFCLLLLASVSGSAFQDLSQAPIPALSRQERFRWRIRVIEALGPVRK